MKRYKILAADRDHMESLFNDYKKDMHVLTNGSHIKELETIDGSEFIVITIDKKLFENS
jgi:hypothetical protein